MKKLLLTTLLLTISTIANANNYHTEPTFCEWLGNAGSIIAQNRDKGMSETDLIKNYLEQQQSYEEQLIIIPLIDRVYNKKEYLTPDEIAFVEKRQCVIG